MNGTGNISFSQFGEDTIMLKMLERYNVEKITYLDIGANEPISSSNTYSFYLRGYRGVLVEPNSVLCRKLSDVRPNDVCLNYGISSDNQKEADYYMFGNGDHAMNTFSEEDARAIEKEGFKIQEVVKMPLKNINDVIAENFSDAPTIISLDVEGLDEIILSSLNFHKYQPLLICVETVAYNRYGELKKKTSILDLLASKGYFVYADTHVNTIFCSERLFADLISKNKQ